MVNYMYLKLAPVRHAVVLLLAYAHDVRSEAY